MISLGENYSPNPLEITQGVNEHVNQEEPANITFQRPLTKTHFKREGCLVGSLVSVEWQPPGCTKE